MIQWANPVVLWALPLALLPLLLRPPHRTAEPVTVPFAGMQFLRATRVRPHSWRLITAIRITTLMLLIFGFAQPRWIARGSVAPARAHEEVAVRPANNPFLRALLGARPTEGMRGLDFQPAGPIRSGDETIAPGPYFHPALSAVGDLAHIRVYQWVSLTVTGRTVVLLRLRNGDPLLVEENGWIRSAVALDPAWTDLPFQPQVVPLVQELTRYLRHPAAEPDSTPRTILDLGRLGLAVVLVLAVAEIWLAGHRAWKWLPIAAVAWLVVNPTVPGAPSLAAPPLTVVDRTDSMMIFRDLPAGDVELRGSTTDLGTALLSLSNRPIQRIVLYTDGQHNTGPDPVWAAAQLHVPIEVPPLAAVDYRDVCIREVEQPTHAVRGRPVTLSATFVATGFDAPRIHVRLGPVHTNIAPGRLTITLPAEPDLVWEVEPLPNEITLANNRRPVPLRVLDRPIRVYLSGPPSNWEYRHLRRIMAAHPLVELVERAPDADVTLPATGETWRLRQRGERAYRNYWYQRLAPHLPPALTEPAPELYRLGLDESLRADLARVGAAIPKPMPSRRDLRDSAELVILLGGLFLAGWAMKPVLKFR